MMARYKDGNRNSNKSNNKQQSKGGNALLRLFKNRMNLSTREKSRLNAGRATFISNDETWSVLSPSSRLEVQVVE